MLGNKYDLIISLGEDCACSSYLRRCNLQRYSYPFDWLTMADFDTRIDLLLNHFDGFLQKKNMRQMPKPTAGNVDVVCDYYHDLNTDFYFYHDFKSGLPFDVAYKEVREKYNRRISRLYEQIQKSHKILFVWWSRDKQHDDAHVVSAHARLAENFPDKDICLLVIEHGDKYSSRELANDRVRILHYDNTSWRHNPKYNETMGNERNNMRVFRRLALVRTPGERFDSAVYAVLKLGCAMIPVAKTRRALRNKLKARFLHAKL